MLSARLRFGWALIPVSLMLAYAGILFVMLVSDMHDKDWPQETADMFLLNRQVATAVGPSGTMTLDDMLRSGRFASSEAVHSANQAVAQTLRTAFWLKIGIPRLDGKSRPASMRACSAAS